MKPAVLLANDEIHSGHFTSFSRSLWLPQVARMERRHDAVGCRPARLSRRISNGAVSRAGRHPYRPRFTSLACQRKNKKITPTTASCCRILVLRASIADLVAL
jgi:hypothetical protein